MLAISAYMFLLKNVRPAVATSYAYVNPVVAVLLGIGFAGESLAPREWLALAIIVAAVVLVTLGKYLFPPGPRAGHRQRTVAIAKAVCGPPLKRFLFHR